MNCARCGGASNVTDSRRTPVGNIRRRRRCLACDQRWSTIEIPAEQGDMLEKIGRLFAPRAMPIDSKRIHPPAPVKRHGIIVPPETEADWNTLKANGYSDRDAARTLKIFIPEQSK